MQYWEKWQNEALDAVHTNEWKPKSKKHVEEFAKQVDKLIQTANEAHFCDEMFSRLCFEELDHRLNSIPAPHPGSFEWMFDDAQRDRGGLLDWLGNTQGDNFFWVTGKPGSGKTAAMKFLFRNPRVFDYLEAWSGHAPGITSGFFFWNCGSSLQKSGVGLLRSLLYESLQDMIYGPLEQDEGIVQWLFADRWSQFTSYGGGLYEFSFPELRRSFELMISDVSKKFLFVVDGLDEFDDSSVNQLDVIPMLLSATKKDNVKICVSSRMSPAFQEAFEKRPKVVLDHHNGRDIHAFVKQAFNQDDALARLANTDRTIAHYIVSTLSEKACGIFLWATLATSFLIYGLPDDSVSLESRADALPSDMEPLLAHMLSAFNPTDLEVLWKLSVLIEDHGYPSLVPLWHALHADAASALAADIRPLEPGKVASKVTSMRELVTHKCRSFFSVFETSGAPTGTADGASYKVTYTHRLIRDHLSSSPAQKGKLLAADFNTTSAWANAHLLSLKTLAPSSPIWPPLARALECALTLYTQSNIFPLTYTDAALDTALHAHTARTLNPPPPPTTSASTTSTTTTTITTPHDTPLHANAHTPADLPSFPPTHALTTALDLATLLNLPFYSALKAPSAPRKQVRHALDFSRAARRRMGLGGESAWLCTASTAAAAAATAGTAAGGGGGAGARCERLGAEFGRVRTEVEGLLEYYAKAVRFGTAKPFVEVPEYN
jgi:hypothetical protein